MASAPTFNRQRPFLRAQALAAGITDTELRTSAFRRELHGVYVDSSAPRTPLLRAQAVLAPAGPDAWASHATAGRVHGVPLPPLPDEHVSAVRETSRHKRAGVRCHVAPGSSGLVIRDGTRISSPEQCFVELATQLDLVDLVVVGDWLARWDRTTPGRLREFCSTSKHVGARRARAAAAYVRERVDSPMETRLRMLIVLAGLPEPEVNLTIRDVDGVLVRRYDLSWPEARVIVEYDGRDHVERIEQWEKDLTRREAIDDEGWRILVVIADGIYKHPEQTLERVRRLLRARGLRGVPRRLSSTWRPHFPGHAD